jgi:uncharacterized membrane protein
MKQIRWPESSHLEEVLGRVLLAGVTLSTIVLSAGLFLWMAAPASQVGLHLLRAGLVVLMVTPVMRVLVSFAQYLHDRDWLFAALTGTVLLVLAGSLVSALL